MESCDGAVISLDLPPNPLRILCLGAHADDVEIGAWGLLKSLVGAGRVAELRMVIFSATGERAREAEASASSLGNAVSLEIHSFRERYFPYEAGVKEEADRLGTFSPDLVLAPWWHDLHQDHRTLGEIAAQTFRASLILGYEIPKYDGDLGRPSVYAPLTSEIANDKLDHLLKAFPTQANRSWYRRDVFQGLLHLRGIECQSPSGFAEAFHASKLRLGWG
jgi:LmbE family N-acetylglucosaminyl deacetylase